MQRILVLAAIAFCLYYLVTRPAEAADIVAGAIGLLGQTFDAVITFLTSLLS